MIQFPVSKRDGVYTATGANIPVVTDGEPFEVLIANRKEAVDLYFEHGDPVELGFGRTPLNPDQLRAPPRTFKTPSLKILSILAPFHQLVIHLTVKHHLAATASFRLDRIGKLILDSFVKSCRTGKNAGEAQQINPRGP